MEDGYGSADVAVNAGAVHRRDCEVGVGTAAEAPDGQRLGEVGALFGVVAAGWSGVWAPDTEPLTARAGQAVRRPEEDVDGPVAVFPLVVEVIAGAADRPGRVAGASDVARHQDLAEPIEITDAAFDTGTVLSPHLTVRRVQAVGTAVDDVDGTVLSQAVDAFARAANGKIIFLAAAEVGGGQGSNRRCLLVPHCRARRLCPVSGTVALPG